MLDRSPSRTRINNGRARIDDVSPGFVLVDSPWISVMENLCLLPVPPRPRFVPNEGLNGVRKKTKEDNGRERVSLDAQATELLYVRSSKS